MKHFSILYEYKSPRISNVGDDCFCDTAKDALEYAKEHIKELTYKPDYITAWEILDDGSLSDDEDTIVLN